MNSLVAYEMSVGERARLGFSALGTAALTLLSTGAATADMAPALGHIQTADHHIPESDVTQHSVEGSVRLTCPPVGLDCDPQEVYDAALKPSTRGALSKYFDKYQNALLTTYIDPESGHTIITPEYPQALTHGDTRMPDIKTKKLDISIGDPVTCAIERHEAITSYHIPDHTVPGKSLDIGIPIPAVWVRRQKKPAEAEAEHVEPVQQEAPAISEVATPKPSPLVHPELSTELTEEKIQALQEFLDAGSLGYRPLDLLMRTMDWMEGSPFDHPMLRNLRKGIAAITAIAAFGALPVAYYESGITKDGCGTNISKTADSWNPHMHGIACDDEGQPLPPLPAIERLDIRFTGCDNVDVKIPGLPDALTSRLANKLYRSEGFFQAPRMPEGEQAMDRAVQGMVQRHNVHAAAEVE